MCNSILTKVLFDIVLPITLQTHNCKDINHTADEYRLVKVKVYNLSVNLIYTKLPKELQLHPTYSQHTVLTNPLFIFMFKTFLCNSTRDKGRKNNGEIL